MNDICLEDTSLYNKESLLNNKSFSFAVRIVEMVKYIRKHTDDFVLSKQIIRSGTAIEALIMESEYAQSKSDFINKLSIALKEANETQYWLLLLNQTGYLEDKLFVSMKSDCGEIMALLTASVKTAKNCDRGKQKDA